MLLIILFLSGCNNNNILIEKEKLSLQEKIGSMLIIGFFGTSVKLEDSFCHTIKKYNIGGVILFDKNPIDKTKVKNISSREQLQKLTKELKACKNDILIAIDQEGGQVNRLKKTYGFHGKYPSAYDISKQGPEKSKIIYNKMAQELAELGINFNLAPVVDLKLNPNNKVINRAKRSYGENPSDVYLYSLIFKQAMNKKNIYTSLKHFPGHGSTIGDTHKGFVDGSSMWNKNELEPYERMIKSHDVDSIMVSHVYNKKFDQKHVASLSGSTINELLRKRLGYEGIVISDDYQMNSINENYKLNEVLMLSINAGVDFLLFANQLHPSKIVTPEKLVGLILELINTNHIEPDTIDKAYKRIKRFKAKYLKTI